MDGVQDGAGVLEWAALAASGDTGTDPSGVEQPGVGLVSLDLLSEHLGVAHWVESKEGLGEAGREGGLRLSDTLLGSGHLGGVSGDEVEHGLGGVELGNWWENTASVAGEENDVLWVSVRNTRNLGIVDVLNWVGTTGVLGEGDIVVVDETGLWIEDNVLKDGAELDGVVNIWLLLGRETNALGVAASLNVEDTGVGPAVLVITDEHAVLVGGEGSLAGSGKTEENGDISILTLVGGGVKSENIVLDWHLVEENSEDTLLHLTGVLSTKDDHLLLGEVNGDGGWGGHSLGVSVGWERSGVVDGVIWMEVLKILAIWADQHVAHEESVVGTRADDADLDLVLLVPSCETVDNVDAIPGVEVIDGTLTVNLPDLQVMKVS